MTIDEWLFNVFGIDVIDTDNVVSFINEPIKNTIKGLTKEELKWLLIYDIVDKKKYNNKDLTLQQKLFIRAMINAIKDIENSIQINFDIHELWVKYGN